MMLEKMQIREILFWHASSWANKNTLGAFLFPYNLFVLVNMLEDSEQDIREWTS